MNQSSTGRSLRDTLLFNSRYLLLLLIGQALFSLRAFALTCSQPLALEEFNQSFEMDGVKLVPSQSGSGNLLIGKLTASYAGQNNFELTTKVISPSGELNSTGDSINFQGTLIPQSKVIIKVPRTGIATGVSPVAVVANEGSGYTFVQYVVLNSEKGTALGRGHLLILPENDPDFRASHLTTVEQSNGVTSHLILTHTHVRTNNITQVRICQSPEVQSNQSLVCRGGMTEISPSAQNIYVSEYRNQPPALRAYTVNGGLHLKLAHLQVYSSSDWGWRIKDYTIMGATGLIHDPRLDLDFPMGIGGQRPLPFWSVDANGVVFETPLRTAFINAPLQAQLRPWQSSTTFLTRYLRDLTRGFFSTEGTARTGALSNAQNFGGDLFSVAAQYIEINDGTTQSAAISLSRHPYNQHSLIIDPMLHFLRNNSTGFSGGVKQLRLIPLGDTAHPSPSERDKQAAVIYQTQIRGPLSIWNRLSMAVCRIID